MAQRVWLTNDLIGRNGIDKVPPHTVLSREFPLPPVDVSQKYKKKKLIQKKNLPVFEFHHGLMFTFLIRKKRLSTTKKKERRGKSVDVLG